MFMTEDQKKYYKAMKRMASKSPQKSIPRPDVSVNKCPPSSCSVISTQLFSLSISAEWRYFVRTQIISKKLLADYDMVEWLGR